MPDCIEPGTIREEDLAAFALDPSGDARLGAHVAQCQACAATVNEMRVLANHLSTRLARHDCPSIDDLDAYMAREMSAARLEAIDHHLKECSRCAEEVALSQDFFAQADRLLTWQSPPAPNLLRRLVAALQPQPGGATNPGLALRGAPNAANAPHIYTVDDVMVALRYLADPQARAVQGQLQGMIGVAEDMAVMMAAIPVRLLAFAGDAADPTLFAETTAEMGLFEFALVPPGRYQLELTLPGRLIVIEALIL